VQVTTVALVITQVIGTGVVFKAPVAVRWKSLNSVPRNGVIEAGSMGSVKVTLNPVGAALDGSAATVAPTFRVVKLFTSLQSATMQPSALSFFPDTASVMVVAVRTSYFCPNFGWYEAGSAMVN